MNVTIRAYSASLSLLGSLLLAVSLSTSAVAEPQLLDKVAVVVEDDIIMESQLQSRLAMVQQNIAQQNIDAPEPDEIRHQVMERMIVESLQMQMGERAGVRITDEALNEAITNIAQQNGMTLPQFRAALAADGASYVEMRENIRREMVLKRVQQGNVNNRVQITEHEVDNFLQSDEGKKMTSPSYRVGHFMLVANEDMSDSERESAAQQADALVAELRQGKMFEELAQQKSYNGIAAQSGDLGWRKQDDLPSIFADVVPALNVGETADIVATESGWHIIKLLDQRGGEARMVEQTQARHILIKPSEILTDVQAQQKMLGIHNQIVKEEGDFAELAKQHSEDIGSASEGGELGWTSPGQMVPEFEQAMAATEIGQLSEPFKSQYGWHIVKVEGRRSEDVSGRILKNQASQFIYQRKFEEELEAWLQKIRDEAYVDIK